MTVNDPKMAVLAVLQQAQQPISLSNILSSLSGSDLVAERSVRRWLSEWIQQDRVGKIGNKKATRYFLMSSAVASDISAAASEPAIFSKANQQQLQKIRQPLFKRAPVTYHREWLLAYQPNQTFYLSAQQRQTLRAQGENTILDAPAGTYARQIFNRLLIDLSYNSSRLEGNTYSKLETERLLLQGEATADKLNEETIMILNHKEAIRYLVDNAHRLMVTADTITTLHYLLADGLVPTHLSGRVRDHGVRVGQSTYIPLEVEAQLQALLEKICRLAKQINDPFEQSFFLLLHLAYLQPFTDVNKRTSRLSANIPLICHNLVPLSFSDVPKDDYLDAMLLVYECQQFEPLAELYQYSYLRTCQSYHVTADAMGIDQTRVRFRQARRQLLGDIIRQQLTTPQLKAYIQQYTAQHIPLENQSAFLGNVDDDLRLLSPSRLVGLGVSDEQFKQWQTLKNHPH
jgi:hypothetical protein